MDTEKIIESICEKLLKTLDSFESSKNLEDQVKQSMIIRNLSKSLGVFYEMPGAYQANDISEDDEDEINNAIDDALS